MTSGNIHLDPVRLGGIPIAKHFLGRAKVSEAFERHVQSDPRDKISVANTLAISLMNIILERFPLYKMASWSKERGLLCQENAQRLNDDRIGRALDRLFKADRAALLTDVVLAAIREFGLDTSRVHNDSTSVTLTGQYDGYRATRAAQPKRGHNKDHRPDLKQLLFSLSVAGDEAVPIYFKVWDGNVTDDRTHIKNWMALRGLLGRSDFTYVSDSKFCVRENMEFVDSEGGYFVTVMPQTRSEDRRFKDWIQSHQPQWQEVIRRPDPNRKYAPQHVYWTFESPFLTSEGFRIVWIKSSQKEIRDAQTRQNAIDRTTQDLTDLSARNFKNRDKLDAVVESVFKEYGTRSFFQYRIETFAEKQFRQDKKGRPGPDTKYTRIERKRHRLTWSHNQDAIRYCAKCDGIFPLVTNRRSDHAKDILQIYKFQPRLERRHSQLKSVYDVAPVFLKNPERIEALLFLYFLALMVDGLIERQVRIAMKENKLTSIPIYPEDRACRRPTADKIYDLFRDVRFHKVTAGAKTQIVPDTLSATQTLVLKLLSFRPHRFFEIQAGN